MLLQTTRLHRSQTEFCFAAEKYFLNIFQVLRRRSNYFHARRQMSLVGSILAEVQLCSTLLEPPPVEPFDNS